MPGTDRPGAPDSGAAEIASGDGATDVTTVLDTRSDALFEATKIIITYPSAGAATQVEFFDDPDGTADGDLSADVLTVDVEAAAGAETVLEIDEPMLRDFENDVLVEPDGNQDQAIQVYVGGKDITAPHPV